MQFGNQGGMGEFLGASQEISESMAIFQTSAGGFTAAILSFVKFLKNDQFKKIIGSMSDMMEFLKEITDVFAISKLVDSIAYLTTGVYKARKELTKTFSFTESQLSERVAKLRTDSRTTQEFGIGMEENLEAYVALSDRMRNFDRASGIVGITSMVAKGFELTNQQAAELTSGLVRFGQKSAGDIEKFFDNIEGSSLAMKLSHDDVASNMTTVTDKMYRFDLGSKRGAKNFKDMALYATKIGVSMESIIEAVDEFRSIEGAMGATAKASRFGLMMNPSMLLASSRGGDMTAPTRMILEHLAGFVDPKTGALSQIGMDVADNLGPLVGLGRDELANILEIMHKDNLSIIDAQKKVSDRMKKQMFIGERLDSILASLMDFFVGPLAQGVLKIIDSILQHTRILEIVAASTIGIWLLLKGRQGVNWIHNRRNPVAGIGGPEFYPRDYDQREHRRARISNRPSPMGGPAASPSRTLGTGMSPAQIKAYGNVMLKSAAPMIAFGLATMMLAKAFQMLDNVGWDGVGKGAVTMGLLVGALAALGLLMKSPIGIAIATGGFALSAVLLAIGGSMLLLGKAMQSIDGVNIGDNLKSMAEGLGAMGAVGLFGLGAMGAVTTIGSLGVVAKKYATPIETLSYAMERLASSMQILSTVDVTKIKSALNGLGENAANLIGNVSNRELAPIIVDVTLELDGQKLLRKQLQTSPR